MVSPSWWWSRSRCHYSEGRSGTRRSPPPFLAPQRLLGLIERVRSLTVGKQITELPFALCADCLVERDRRRRGRQGLFDVLDREAGRLRELLLTRLPAELDLEPPRRAPQLLLTLDDVHRDSDRARVISARALYRLPDPPGGVRGELVAPPPVELLDRAVQAERAFLNQIEKRDAKPAVALRDRDNEPQVRLDHLPLRDLVAALDPLREDDLLRRRQQPMTADVGQKELQTVAGTRQPFGLIHDILGLLLGSRFPHLEPYPLKLASEILDLRVSELMLDHERLQLGRFDPAALLPRLDHRLPGLTRQQLGQPVLRYFRPHPCLTCSRTVLRGREPVLRPVFGADPLTDLSLSHCHSNLPIRLSDASIT